MIAELINPGASSSLDEKILSIFYHHQQREIQREHPVEEHHFLEYTAALSDQPADGSPFQIKYGEALLD
jgi:hypothetical protein